MSRLAKSFIIIVGLVFGFAGAIQFTWPFLVSSTDALICKKLGHDGCEARKLRFADDSSQTASAGQPAMPQLLGAPPPPPGNPGDENLSPPPPPPGPGQSNFAVENKADAVPRQVEASEVITKLEQDDISALETWLSQGHTVDTSLNEQGTTALMIAALNGSPQLATRLIQLGANPSAKDSAGNTSLHALPSRLDKADRIVPTLKVLLAARGDLESKNNQGATPLIHATEQGNIHAVKALLNFKPSLDAQDKNGLTALHYATRAKRTDLAGFLIQSGANPSVKDRKGITPRQLAKDSKNQDLIKVFSAKISKPKSKPEAIQKTKVEPLQKPKPTPTPTPKPSSKTSSKKSEKKEKPLPRAYPKPNKR